MRGAVKCARMTVFAYIEHLKKNYFRVFFGVKKRAPINRDAQNTALKFFYHPDYTVGTGISPVRELSLFADFTAGGELHSAPKNIRLILL